MSVRAGAGYGLQAQRRVDLEAEAAATGLHDPDRGLALVEPALEEDEPALGVWSLAGSVLTAADHQALASRLGLRSAA